MKLGSKQGHDPGNDQGSDARPPFWSLKPWWCQPWSLLLTGTGVVLGSWLLLHRWWISGPLALGVLVWWWLFLVQVPAAWRAGLLDGPEQD